MDSDFSSNVHTYEVQEKNHEQTIEPLDTGYLTTTLNKNVLMVRNLWKSFRLIARSSSSTILSFRKASQQNGEGRNENTPNTTLPNPSTR